MTPSTVSRVASEMWIAYSPDETPKKVTFHTRLGKGKYLVRQIGTPRPEILAGNKKVWIATTAEVEKLEAVEASKPKRGRPKGSKNKPKVVTENVTVTTTGKRGRPVTPKAKLTKASEQYFAEGDLTNARKYKRLADAL